MRLNSIPGTRSGGNKTEVPIGGNISISNNVVTHSFATNANLMVPLSLSANVLAVGGGGGGGAGSGGGGGAGGLFYKTNYEVHPNQYAINIGPGGLGAETVDVPGHKGDNTTFNVGSIGTLTNLPTGTGVTYIDNDGEKILAFDTPGNYYFTVSGGPIKILEILAVGAGGGGGSGSGGGPGQYVYKKDLIINPGNYVVEVGTGGTSDSLTFVFTTTPYWKSNPATNGTRSFFSLVGQTGANVAFVNASGGTAYGAGGATPITKDGFTSSPQRAKDGTNQYSELLAKVNFGQNVAGFRWISGYGGGGGRAGTSPSPYTDYYGTGATGGYGGGGNGNQVSGANPYVTPPTDGLIRTGGGGGSGEYHGSVISNTDPMRTHKLGGTGGNGFVIIRFQSNGALITANGGGGGNSLNAVAINLAGSGGGGSGGAFSYQQANKGIAGLGTDGGTGVPGFGAGGGGSLGYNSNQTATSGKAGDGGAPTPLDITGSTVYYAGGGGGAINGAGNQSGGAGGAIGSAGVNGTGGGGGGSNNTTNDGSNRGGDGFAAVKYSSIANQGIQPKLYNSINANVITTGNWITLKYTADKPSSYLGLTQFINAEIVVIGAGGRAHGYPSQNELGNPVGPSSGAGGGIVWVKNYTLSPGSYQIRAGIVQNWGYQEGFGSPAPSPDSFSALGGNSFIRNSDLTVNLIGLGGGSSGNYSLPGGSSAGQVWKFAPAPAPLTAYQKLLPGDSGKYGYGNPGGVVYQNYSQGFGSGGGAGTAGTAGSSGVPGKGGDGLLLTIEGVLKYYSAGGYGIDDYSNAKGTNGLGFENYGSGGNPGTTTTQEVAPKPGAVFIKWWNSNITSGGYMYQLGNYTIHAFTEVGLSTFQTKVPVVADIMVVAGGGGGAWSGGGGGAGGYIAQTNTLIPAGTYNIKTGDGGKGGVPGAVNGTNGEDSYINGLSFGSSVVLANGGSSSIVGTDMVHTFINSGIFTVYSTISVQVLAVAGGGSGGGPNASMGGGGAGGLLAGTVTLTPGNYVVTIGAGGVATLADLANGSDTTITSTSFNITAYGGGSGGYPDSTGMPVSNKMNGGSGGASSGTYQGSNTTTANTGGTNTQTNSGGLNGYGYAGGGGISGNFGASAGGGGGAGGAGANGTAPANSTGKSGNGGIGYQSNITGANLYYAGGGGGGSFQGSTIYNQYTTKAGAGGAGGGGGGAAMSSGAIGTGDTARGATSGTSTQGGNGGPNTGGGAGGGSFNAGTWRLGGNGGSGIVIFRYNFASAGTTTYNFIAVGGGGGVGNTGTQGLPGGSGGGGSTSAGPGAGTGGQGNSGGFPSTKTGAAGGGGGYLEPGFNAFDTVTASSSQGGSGIQNEITGIATYYAGGGGGGGIWQSTGIPGGKAGSGGAAGSNTGVGNSALPNSGGGGGGGAIITNNTSNGYNGGNGGTGIVVIRYLTNDIPLGNM